MRVAAKPPPMPIPTSMPCAAASATPSLRGLPSAAFRNTCSCADCGSSSSTPSTSAAVPTRFKYPGFSAAPAPPASAISTSGRPSFVANAPDLPPISPFNAPDVKDAATCPAESVRSSVSCRIDSAVEPPLTRPSPIPAATAVPAFGASFRTPCAIAPPPNVDGIDSTIACPIVDGLSTM